MKEENFKIKKPIIYTLTIHKNQTETDKDYYNIFEIVFPMCIEELFPFIKEIVNFIVSDPKIETLTPPEEKI